MKYTKEDAIEFEKSDSCRKCICRSSCESQNSYEELLKHVVSCPRIFNWKIGFKSFIEENIDYLKDHPEVAEQQQKRIKQWLSSKRKKTS